MERSCGAFDYRNSCFFYLKKNVSDSENDRKRESKVAAAIADGAINNEIYQYSWINYPINHNEISRSFSLISATKPVRISCEFALIISSDLEFKLEDEKERESKTKTRALMTFRDIKFLITLVINCSPWACLKTFPFIHPTDLRMTL